MQDTATVGFLLFGKQLSHERHLYWQCQVHGGETGVLSTLREVLVQVRGEVNNKDFGVTHLDGT